MRELNKIIVHCSATPEGRDVSTEEIRQWHIDRGWSDIGYHFVVELDGTVYDGRPVEDIGAHTKGHNADSIGVCYVGGVNEDGQPKDTRTPEQVVGLLDLLIDLRNTFGKHITLHGHNEFSDKACPSFNVQEEYANIDAIAEEKEKGLE